MPRMVSGGAVTFEKARSPRRVSGGKGDMLAAALLEVRVFPWRLRTRVMRASTFRDKISSVDPTLGTDDLSGLVVGLAVWLTIMLAAPLLVLILAGALFSVEVPVLVIVALALVLARFTGLIPWTVVIVDRISGQEQRESTRSFVRAVRRVRDINGDRRIVVRWAWS
jgi:hypothetical protein